MVILITGASHTGKTLLAQKLLEKYHYPYLSIDHLKMGLIRSGQTDLTPMDDEKLTDYLWPILREMIKTAIENQQNLIVEGCYIPANWAADFTENYLEHIRYLCLVFTKAYIENNSGDILRYANAIESRMENDVAMAELIRDNENFLRQCEEKGLPYVLIDRVYDMEEIMQSCL